MSAPTIMRVTANGQMSIPAEVRHRWNTDRVTVVDTPWGLVVRPFDPDPVARIGGSYERRGPTVDAARRRDRTEDARQESRRGRA